MPLHPTIAAMLDKMRLAGRPALADGTPEDARRLVADIRAALGKGPPIGATSELRIRTRDGSVGARLYQPAEPPAGLVVYIHGGGWVVGALDDYDTLATTLCARTGCCVLMPDYRLAPEHPFPAGLNDVEDVVAWAAGSPPELGGSGRPRPLVLAGDSAGANLATIAAAALAPGIAIAAQILIYPVADCDFERSSYREFSEGLPLTAADMQWFFGHYAPKELHTDPRISPLRAGNAGSLPLTVVVTAEYDVLRDEGEAYADKLAAAGRLIAKRRALGLPHGFIRLHNLVDSADEALAQIAQDITSAIRR